MIRALEARALVAGGFHETLLVGLFAGQRALGKQLARLQRNFPELDRSIERIAPLADVMPPVAHFDDLEVVAADILEFLLIIVAIASPATLLIVAIDPLRRARFLDVYDTQMHRAIRAL